MDDPVLTFCIDCNEMCLEFILSDREFFFCNNPKCLRFGLLTAITTPVGNIPDDIKDDLEQDEHKKI